MTLTINRGLSKNKKTFKESSLNCKGNRLYYNNSNSSYNLIDLKLIKLLKVKGRNKFHQR